MIFILKMDTLQIQKYERLILQIWNLFIPFNQLIL